MAELTALERSDPIVAEKVLGLLFEESTSAAKQRYLEFLKAAIEHLSQHHPDRWGITLFSDLVRLNAGIVESLVLHPKGLRVLVDSASAPADAVFEEGTAYRSAPGCAVVSLSFSQIPDVLTSLAVAHHTALSIAAKRKCTPAIRRAHSIGVTKFVGHVLDRLIPNPTLDSSVDTTLLAHFDEVADPQAFSEGERLRVWVNRFERDSRAREACLSSYGSRCSICLMSFYERYGETMRDFIHVHHLRPISQIGTSYDVDPVADLRPVCPNCHAVIHQRNPPLSIEEARALLSAVG
jgi:5-methylcytosine-specific restriction protein A